MYNSRPDDSVIGGLSVGVPGEIMGYSEAHKIFGDLPWKRLFQESIDITRDGFVVPQELANRIKKHADFIQKDPDWNFLVRDGITLTQYDLVYRKTFSNTLKTIAEEGPMSFYNGSISKSLVAYIRKKGGIMSKTDFAKYTVRIEDPIRGWYHGREILTCAAPCSGPALIQALNILEGYQLGKKGKMTPEGVHLLVEAMKCSLNSDFSNIRCGCCENRIRGSI
jgi:gamma-glutamyltranspeptidase / glutathione hydrolase / leukotriene-C4 hydrolase